MDRRYKHRRTGSKGSWTSTFSAAMSDDDTSLVDDNKNSKIRSILMLARGARVPADIDRADPGAMLTWLYNAALSPAEENPNKQFGIAITSSSRTALADLEDIAITKKSHVEEGLKSNIDRLGKLDNEVNKAQAENQEVQLALQRITQESLQKSETLHELNKSKEETETCIENYRRKEAALSLIRDRGGGPFDSHSNPHQCF